MIDKKTISKKNLAPSVVKKKGFIEKSEKLLKNNDLLKNEDSFEEDEIYSLEGSESLVKDKIKPSKVSESSLLEITLVLMISIILMFSSVFIMSNIKEEQEMMDMSDELYNMKNQIKNMYSSYTAYEGFNSELMSNTRIMSNDYNLNENGFFEGNNGYTLDFDTINNEEIFSISYGGLNKKNCIDILEHQKKVGLFGWQVTTNDFGYHTDLMNLDSSLKTDFIIESCSISEEDDLQVYFYYK